MHYIIDGYNLLFRQRSQSSSFQEQRHSIIREINEKAAVVAIDVSLVFDATYQPGDGSRSHYAHVEILFSSFGQTADAFILEELKNCYNPRLETVVTSDKELARLARSYSAHAISIEHFLLWLNRSYEKKSQKKIKPQKIVFPKSTENFVKPAIIDSIPNKLTHQDQCFDYYIKTFETRWHDLVKKETQEFKDPIHPIKIVKRQPRKKKDPFNEQEHLDIKATNEMDRWLKIFERKIQDTE